MEKGKKRIVTLGVAAVAAMVFSLFTAFAQESTNQFEPTKEYWKVVPCEDVSGVRNNPEQLDGYVFAGWFREESCDKSTALKQGENSGSAYAKYVPEEVLGLKAQVVNTLRDNNTQNDEIGAMRFVTSVDSLDYAKVGFIIQVGANGKENDKYSSTVYKTLLATIGSADGKQDTTYHAWDIFHKSSRYFKAWTVTDIGAQYYGAEFYVTPYWTTLDGTVVKAARSMKTVNGGRTWEYVFIDDTGADDTGAGTIGSPYKTLEKALSEMQKNKEIQIAAKFENVNMTGKVYVKESLTAPETGFIWNQHNLDITLTDENTEGQSKASVDFSAVHKISIEDNVTFENVKLKFPHSVVKTEIGEDGKEKPTITHGTIYANGHRLKIAESVEVDSTYTPKVFGGSGSREVKSTHVTLLSGNYANIYAGGENKGVAGDTYIYIGGTVNKDVLKNTEESLHNKNTGKDSLQIFGGSYQATVSGDTHVTVGGSALINYVRGGGNGAKQTVTGTCYVKLQDNAGVYGINGGGSKGSVNNTYVEVSGGTVYQVQGGMTSAGGTVNNTSVQILGGTVKRRIYGGSYNEDDGSLFATGWADTNYHVNGYSTVTIGNGATLKLADVNGDNSLCAVSRNGQNVEPEIGIMILNSGKTSQKVGFADMGGLPVKNVLPTHFLVKVEQGGTAVSEGSVLRITPNTSTAYATVKKGTDVLFQCQGEGTCPFSLFGEKSDNIQNITVEFSDSETISGNYVLSYGDNSHSYFNTLSDAIAAVSTPKTSTDGVITQKTATITIGEETCTVDSTVVIDAGDNVVLQNKEGMAVTLRRDAGLTGTGEFVFDVVKGGSLTIGGTLIVDGNGVTGPSMIDNKGEFTLEKNAVLQNAKSSGNGAALFNRGGIANLYGNMTGNQAKQGGALANSGEVIIHGGEYSNNTSTNEGGVIYSATTGNKLIIENGSFHDNTAKTMGGVVHCTGTLTITGGKYYNNTAAGAGGAINIPYVNNVSQPTTITGADIHDNSLTNSENTDINIAGSATLHLKNNTNVGVVRLQGANAAINMQETYTGNMVLVPYDYTIGSKTVTFAKGTSGSADKIIVRKYTSQTAYTDDAYCVDKAGTLQWKNPEAKIGETVYPTFTEAIAAANNGETISVLKDIEVSDTIAISDNKALTITNVSGKDVKLTRTSNAAMFTVASGSTLTIGSADKTNEVILDGGYVAEAEVPLKTVPLVSNAGTFTFEANATIQNAVTGGTSGTNDNFRGGALNNKAKATVKGTIRGCSAFNGGAIYNATSGEVVVTESAYIAENTADGGNGGAVRNEGILNITGTTFAGNKGEGSNGNGGAIYNTGTLTASGVKFIGNTGRSGGAIFNEKTTGIMTITGGSFTGNQASRPSGSAGGDGGAIYIKNNSGQVSIQGAEFTGNSSQDNNSAAIDVQKAITLISCNIHDNVTHANSADSVYDIRLNATLNLNSTADSEVADNAGVIYYQPKTTAKVNIQKDFTGKVILVPHTYTAGTQVVTFADEPEIDKAAIASKIVVRKVTDGVIDDTTYYVDVEGMLAEIGGAVKVNDTWYETLDSAIADASTGDTIFVWKDIELSTAVNISENQNLTITNASGRNVTLTRTGDAAMFTVSSGSTLTIGSADKVNAITLDGGNTKQGASLIRNNGTFTLAANATIQNANGGDTDKSAMGGALNNVANATATIKGTIQNCKAYNGGAIYNAANGEVVIEEDAILSGNSAVNGNGGAIRNLGSLTITKATMKNNRGIKNNSTYGNGGAVYNSGKLVAIDVTFKGNSATSGGAIYNNIVSKSTATIEILGGAFVENSASNGTGGAIYNSGTSASITGAEFTKNSSVTNNSATINAQEAITLTDCNIHDNVAFAGSTNPVYDIQLGNAILNLDGNTNTGVVYQAQKDGKVNILENFTGNIILVPNVYTTTQIVTFADGVTDKESIVSKMIVGKGISGQVVNTGKYYIDIDGKLQAHAEAAKVGDTRYATLAEALEAVTTEEPTTIYLMNNAEFSGTLAIGTADTKRNITITNLAGEDITLTRAEVASMINIAAGSSLTIACSEGGTITLDGNSSLKTPHLIKNEGTFVLETGATIQNAVTESKSNDEAYNGGALYNLGNATLKGKFIGCQAFNGGAVFNNAGATLQVIGATFTQNTTAGGNGGAIRNAGTLTVEGSNFIENETATANNGGAIHSSANTLKVTNTNFTSNKAYASGGAIYTTASCEITGGKFNGNTAGTTGGAVYTNANLTIAGGTYNENKAATGGGAVYINQTKDQIGQGDISRVTMQGNALTNKALTDKTKHGGGAIFVSVDAKLTLKDSNICNNASYEANDTILACDIYNAGAADNLALSGITMDDGDEATVDQCLVYRSGNVYCVGTDGNLPEDT